MQCENGYTKDGVRGILCREAEEPKSGDLRSVAHALCGHQRFCPNAGCYTFLPSWEKCTKRKRQDPSTSLRFAQDDPPIGADAPLPPEGEARREENAGEEIAPKAVKSTAKKKRTQKAAE